MHLLFQKQYDESNSDCFELLPIVCSSSIGKLNNYLNDLLKESLAYDNELEKHISLCKSIIKNYLLDNYEAIVGWRDVRSQIFTSYPISNSEKDEVISFLCRSYQYSYGKNIVEVAYGNSMIKKYCDIEKLKKPYPKLPDQPSPPKLYYKKEWLDIKKIQYLD